MYRDASATCCMPVRDSVRNENETKTEMPTEIGVWKKIRAAESGLCSDSPVSFSGAFENQRR